jgi:hypothetical protein
MATTADIEKAIDELRAADKPNVAEIASKYKIERTRLNRLFKGTISTKENYDKRRGLLSPQQDKKLVDLVNRLTRDGLPPTPNTARQLAKDLCGIWPSKNWPHRWLHRHEREIESSHLRGFDLDRKKADSFYQYRAYFELVTGLSTLKVKLTDQVEGEARSISHPTQRHVQYGREGLHDRHHTSFQAIFQ